MNVMKQMRLLYRSLGNNKFRDDLTFNQHSVRNFRHIYLEGDSYDPLVLSTFFQNFGFMLGYNKYETGADILNKYGFKPCVYMPIYLQPYARCYLYKTVSFYEVLISKEEKRLIWNTFEQYGELEEKLAKLPESPYGRMAIRVAELDYIASNASNKISLSPLHKYEYRIISKAITNNTYY